MTIILALLLLVYFIPGILIERRRYAIADFKVKSFEPTNEFYEKKYREAELERESLSHGICNLKYPSLAVRGCDCIRQRKWNKLGREMREAKDRTTTLPAARVEPAIIALWPGYLVGQFIKSGEPPATPEVTRLREIEQARHDAELAEIRLREEVALDEQLELSRKRLGK